MHYIEAGRTMCEDTTFMKELRHNLLMDMANSKFLAAASKPQCPIREAPYIPIPLNSQACSLFQTGKCSHEDSHGKQQHVCSFCLKVTRRLYPSHGEAICRRKASLLKN